MYSTVHFPNRPRSVTKSNSYLNLPFNLNLRQLYLPFTNTLTVTKTLHLGVVICFPPFDSEMSKDV